MKKLQSEIDRLLKKVGEGIETTENLFDKIQNSSSSNQKDKFEADLKKEIKKLQRHRDQIKTWLSSNDVKDKRPLTEHRRLIESQMERFKQVEKEMKIKTYSKEGLLQMERMDPKEKEKVDACEFITNTVDELSRQIETIEFEIEQLEGANSKRGNRKSDFQRAERVSQKVVSNERRKHHINRLELILRLLENDQLQSEQVNNLKEAIQYYVECNQEPDFEEDENLYEDLNLEKEEELYNIRTGEFNSKADSGNEDNADEVEKEESHSSLTTPDISQAKTNIKPRPKSVQEKVNTITTKPATVKQAIPSSATSSEPKTASLPSTPKHSEKENAWVEPPKIADKLREKPSTNAKATVLPNDNKDTMYDSAPLPDPLADLGMSFQSIKTSHKNDTEYRKKMLDTSLQHIPDLIDSERPKVYQPTNPFNTPSYYPQQPLVIFDNSTLYEKFDMDTLFYIFYYHQGTYQQYLAAKELKKQSWRFHKKYSTWFQRHEEPKEITMHYEQGTYVYFDYENAWCQRKKTEFRFEYHYLEDS